MCGGGSVGDDVGLSGGSTTDRRTVRQARQVRGRAGRAGLGRHAVAIGFPLKHAVVANLHAATEAAAERIFFSNQSVTDNQSY